MRRSSLVLHGLGLAEYAQAASLPMQAGALKRTLDRLLEPIDSLFANLEAFGKTGILPGFAKDELDQAGRASEDARHSCKKDRMSALR